MFITGMVFVPLDFTEKAVFMFLLVAGHAKGTNLKRVQEILCFVGDFIKEVDTVSM